MEFVLGRFDEFVGEFDLALTAVEEGRETGPVVSVKGHAFDVVHETTRLETQFGSGRCVRLIPESLDYSVSRDPELTGRLETVLHEFRTFCRRVEKLIKDVRYRLEALFLDETERRAALPAPRPVFAVTPLSEVRVAIKAAKLRAKSSTQSGEVGRLAVGDKVTVTGKTEVAGSVWYRVALAGGDVGYVFGPSLLRGPQIAVVTRPMPAVPSPTRPAVGVFPKKPGETFKDCADCPEMVVIPAGRFRMGSPSGESGRYENEGPVHGVRIGRFALGKYEVTKAEFAAFVRDSGYDTGGGCWVYTGGDWKQQASTIWRDPGFAQTDRDPVACVSWDDAKAYAGWLSRQTGKAYRLASESEWEYAARAGTTTARHWGDDADAACGYANVADRTAKERYGDWPIHNCRDGQVHTAPVGTYRANGFGVHDMLGNVWEWVEDCWNESESYAGAPGDGEAWTWSGCRHRVLRGGAWVDKPGDVRAANRFEDVSGVRGYYSGFRVARTF